MNKPLTLEQANNICLTYQFLEGTPFDRDFGNTTPILSVVVAPYQEQAQQEFMDDYDLLGYTDLSAYNPADGYDVIVIARYQPDEEICLWTDLRSFVKKNINQVARYHKAHIISGAQGEIAA
ncbi:MAG: hypothetical protein EOP49_17005 [Sphingobacteriales bacterium]|nr:MAG: hypothetical protein EOP49_17005 [Sphingobacteriales bacterium]